MYFVVPNETNSPPMTITLQASFLGSVEAYNRSAFIIKARLKTLHRQISVVESNWNLPFEPGKIHEDQWRPVLSRTAQSLQKPSISSTHEHFFGDEHRLASTPE